MFDISFDSSFWELLTKVEIWPDPNIWPNISKLPPLLSLSQHPPEEEGISSVRRQTFWRVFWNNSKRLNSNRQHSSPNSLVSKCDETKSTDYTWLILISCNYRRIFTKRFNSKCRINFLILWKQRKIISLMCAYFVKLFILVKCSSIWWGLSKLYVDCQNVVAIQYCYFDIKLLILTWSTLQMKRWLHKLQKTKLQSSSNRRRYPADQRTPT